MMEGDDHRAVDPEPRGLTLALASLLGHVLGMAACGAVGVWLVAEAVGAPGPAWSRIVFGAAGTALAVGGVGLGVAGIRRFVRWTRSGAYGRRLEQRARELGLPTDPEAYQDGGIGVALTTTTVPEADAAAAYLNACGVPAWVDQGYASTTLSHLQYAINPGGVRVMVPVGRLGDAQEALADHTSRRGEEQDTDEEEEEEEPEVSGTETPSPPTQRRAKRAVSGLLILMGIMMLTLLPAGLGPLATGGQRIASAIGTLLRGLFGLGLCVAGLWGLLRR